MIPTGIEIEKIEKTLINISGSPSIVINNEIYCLLQSKYSSENFAQDLSTNTLEQLEQDLKNEIIISISNNCYYDKYGHFFGNIRFVETIREVKTIISAHQ